MNIILEVKPKCDFTDDLIVNFIEGLPHFAIQYLSIRYAAYNSVSVVFHCVSIYSVILAEQRVLAVIGHDYSIDNHYFAKLNSVARTGDSGLTLTVWDAGRRLAQVQC